MEEHLHILRPLPLFTHELQTAAGINTTFRSLLISFFQGSGIPCPTMFANICDGFSSLVDLDLINTPAVRCRAFLSAATGSPHSQAVTVCLSITFHTDFRTEYIDRFQWLQTLIPLILILSTALLCLLQARYHFVPVHEQYRCQVVIFLDSPEIHILHPLASLKHLHRPLTTGFCARFFLVLEVIACFKTLLSLPYAFNFSYIFIIIILVDCSASSSLR